MASINDVDVTEYIERLRQLSGLEIDTAKSGTQNLSEIIDIALSYIEKDKKKVLVNIDTHTQMYIYKHNNRKNRRKIRFYRTRK